MSANTSSSSQSPVADVPAPQASTPVEIRPSRPGFEPVWVENGEGGYTQVSQDASPGEIEEIEAAIYYIRPAIQADGGDIYLVGVNGGEVTVRLVGACEGCPMSTMTLMAGVDRIIKQMAPWVTKVRAEGMEEPAWEW